MTDISLMWHGSLQWGRRQVHEWHFLAEIYAASLRIFERHPRARMTVQFGGQDLEWLSHAHPELIEQVRRLLDRGQIEVAMGGYSHNFQGSVPALTAANLKFAQDVCFRVLGVRADGYWPAESMLNRGMPRALKNAGFCYSAFDSLNVQNAADMEYAITGKTYRLAGAKGHRIMGLPTSRFTDLTRRGEQAGIMLFALSPSAYQNKTDLILSRLKRTRLVVEISDWEHFNLRKEKIQETQMGTFDIGARVNRIDPEKLAAWDRILTDVEKAGHRFITCREAARRYKPSGTLELVDGRDYTKNDLTRLVDACGWHGSRSSALAGRKDPHHLSDQESYSYSFAGARAWQHLGQLNSLLPANQKTRWEARTKDALISFCSAHRSGGEDFTIKQQLLDRVDRVIEEYRGRLRDALKKEGELVLTRGLPKGRWPVELNLTSQKSSSWKLVRNGHHLGTATVEKAPLRIASLDRTHLLWIDGPIPPGHFHLKPSSRSRDSSAPPRMKVDSSGITLRTGRALMRFDARNGGNLVEWKLNEFSPFQNLGRMEWCSRWQDAPMCDETEVKLRSHNVGSTLHIEGRFKLGDCEFHKTWIVQHDLSCCQLRVTCRQRQFSYLSPCSYTLNSTMFGASGRFLMVAEGDTQVVAEPLMTFHHVHHLGSQLIGFAATKGLATISVNRLCSSPILRRRPLSGNFVLMDSRPIGAADEAHPYTFAQSPVLELTLRMAPGPNAKRTFSEWQSFHDHPPLFRLGQPTLRASRLAWTREIPHISSVNPYF